MTAASIFLQDTLRDYNIDYSLPLPFDRYRLSDEHRTSRGISVSFDFGEDLSQAVVTYSSLNGITLEQLVLASYYAFLFKLTNGESELCIKMNIDGRYTKELTSVIGLFVNTIPLRCQLDPYWSFPQLLDHVQEITTNSLEYSYFPLQRILVQNSNAARSVFLDTAFEFQSYTSKNSKNELIMEDARFHDMSTSVCIDDDAIMGDSDFILTVQYDLDMNHISCSFSASIDLFDRITVDKMTQRFYSMLEHLFHMKEVQINKLLNELSIILPDERLLMKSINNTQVLFSPLACIHHEFIHQVMEHPQKLAVELDNQSLTYSELLYYVQVLSLNLLNKQSVNVGDLVCQCVERSLSMVIGMMTIEIVGAVYCPLSPRDPQHRLNVLIEQTQSRLVLVHPITQAKFDDNKSLNIDSVIIDYEVENDADVNQLTSIKVTPENIAYIIFTSGSTGTPKAAQIRHRNFSESIRSLNSVNTLNENDTVVQMTRCSFDIHVEDIIGTLIIGATIVMLHPRGMIDFEYLITVLEQKQISFINNVPSIFQSLFTISQEYNARDAMKYLRSVCSGGEAFPVKLVPLIRSMVSETCQIWNLYGPAETTIACTFHPVDIMTDTGNIPIGRILPNYWCLILDNFLQSVIVSQEGELYIGGVGVFAGYRERDDLTTKVFVKIEDEIFYRTGDIVKLDNNGLLYYRGRKDYQIKLHGQRIELGEIEQCLLDTSISACVVIKCGEDHLVAYVQGSDIDVEQLRKHCQYHLPPHMVPSAFVLLEKLPLNENGKIDRKLLSIPDFSPLANINQAGLMSLTPLEEHLQRIFSETFHCKSPNVSMPFGQLGGTSIDAIRALVLIRQEICVKVDASLLFANPSVRQLAQTIESLLVTYGDSTIKTIALQLEKDQDRLMPSLCIELLDGVKIAEFQNILCFPSNLLNIERGVTTFGRVNLAPFEMTKEGLCYLNEIHLGSYVNLTNGCTIMPATRLSSKIIVGSQTLVTEKTISTQSNCVLLGIPAREMPFIVPEDIYFVNDSSYSNYIAIYTLLFTCFSLFISKCLFITLYLSLPIVAALFIHAMLFCAIYHYSILSTKRRSHFTYSEVITRQQHFLYTLMNEFSAFVGPYLSGTQCLVFLFRILGAQIGSDVSLPDVGCLTDPHLVKIGDHVRLNRNAIIQAHTFEQRVFKRAPITVNHSSVLMSNTLVLSGSILQGQNLILPWTLVMKDDQLPPNTNWSGVPAKQVI
ncbi:unnamed protein product [Rotaria sp. Silwood2]|nr:unnamed protein product [Rotaria sp. Silwood2]